jgi:hypothetical protein
MGWVEHVACMGGMRIAYKILENVKEKEHLGASHRCENNIKMNLTEKGHEGMDWI